MVRGDSERRRDPRTEIENDNRGVSVIASTRRACPEPSRRVRGNPNVLVLKDFGIASVALLPRNDPGL